MSQDKSGSINQQELSNVLKLVVPDSTPDQRDKIFEIVDENGDGKLEFVEFCDRLVNRARPNKFDATSLAGNREFMAATGPPQPPLPLGEPAPPPPPCAYTLLAAHRLTGVLWGVRMPDLSVPPRDVTHWKDTYSHWQEHAGSKSNNLGVRRKCQQIDIAISPLLPCQH